MDRKWTYDLDSCKKKVKWIFDYWIIVYKNEIWIWLIRNGHGSEWVLKKGKSGFRFWLKGYGLNQMDTNGLMNLG